MTLLVVKNYFLVVSIFFINLIINIFTPDVALSAIAKDQYHLAEKLHCSLTAHIEQQEYRGKWILCINEFNKVYRMNPGGPWAAAGLFRSGLLYVELHKRSFLDADISEAIDIFQRITKRFPQSLYSGKAEVLIKQILQQRKSENDNLHSINMAEKSSLSIGKTESVLGSSKFLTEHITVKNLRAWSNPTYTRVVIDLDGETSFTHKLLKLDPSTKKLQRLYIDLRKSKLSESIKACVQINDELLRSARAGQYAHDTVRVVVDIKSFNSYKIFTLKNPYRVVVDILGNSPDFTKSKDAVAGITFAKDLSKKAITRQLSLGVDKIVIDPGHGGRDYGATGILKDIYEKDITLQIANRLAQKVRNSLDCEVVLTRKTDCYLSLEERTAIANTENADLFVSIHTNAAENKKACGVETFFLNLATDDEAILTAARENATSTNNISDLESILKDLINNAKISESSRLAHNIQSSLCSHVKTKYKYITNKGVKQAPFYVLLGAQMPAVLVETSFISNSRECKRLKDVHYQEILCDGIVMGIKEFIDANKIISIPEQNDGN